MPRKSYGKSVFVNCPFDRAYLPMQRAIVFTALRCGYYPRSALEIEDASQSRLAKIYDIVSECRFGVHDLSRVALDKGLPRFNMPFELGVFLSAKHFGDKAQQDKSCLVFEHTPHSYERLISDIKGQDISAHQGKPEASIRAVRDWLAASKPRKVVPGWRQLAKEYRGFTKWLPFKCKKERLHVNDLTWNDFWNLAEVWIEEAIGRTATSRR